VNKRSKSFSSHWATASAVPSFEDLEPGNCQGFYSDHSDEKFVFHNEDFGGHGTPTCTPARMLQPAVVGHAPGVQQKPRGTPGADLRRNERGALGAARQAIEQTRRTMPRSDRREKTRSSFALRAPPSVCRVMRCEGEALEYRGARRLRGELPVACAETPETATALNRSIAVSRGGNETLDSRIDLFWSMLS
jgi:hypothetical protein